MFYLYNANVLYIHQTTSFSERRQSSKAGATVQKRH